MNVTSVSFHSQGKWLVTGSEDGTIKIWDLRFVYCPHREMCASLQLTSRPEQLIFIGAIITTRPIASSDHTARLWEMASGDTVRQYNGHHKGAA